MNSVNQPMDKKKILIIDDNQDSRHIVSVYLSHFNFEIEQAEDGEIGIAKALKFQPHMILLDMMLPGMDGFEVIENLIELKQKERSIILGFTANYNQNDIDKFLRAGCDGLITKPVNLEKILETIRSFFKIQDTFPNK